MDRKRIWIIVKSLVTAMVIAITILIGAWVMSAVITEKITE